MAKLMEDWDDLVRNSEYFILVIESFLKLF